MTSKWRQGDVVKDQAGYEFYLDSQLNDDRWGVEPLGASVSYWISEETLDDDFTKQPPKWRAGDRIWSQGVESKVEFVGSGHLRLRHDDGTFLVLSINSERIKSGTRYQSVYMTDSTDDPTMFPWTTIKEYQDDINKLEEQIYDGMKDMGSPWIGLPESCEHEWVQVGFTTDTTVCKHCDIEKPEETEDIIPW